MYKAKKNICAERVRGPKPVENVCVCVERGMYKRCSVNHGAHILNLDLKMKVVPDVAAEVEPEVKVEAEVNPESASVSVSESEPDVGVPNRNRIVSYYIKSYHNPEKLAPSSEQRVSESTIPSNHPLISSSGHPVIERHSTKGDKETKRTNNETPRNKRITGRYVVRR